MMGVMAGHRAPEDDSATARRPRGYAGVVGPGTGATPTELALAEEVGRLLAGHGLAVVTGGLGGVMDAASKGAAEAGGLTIGLLPGDSRSEAGPHVAIALPTGLGEMRNALLVRSCDGIVSVGSSWGTLSEVALACRTGVPLVALAGWHLPAVGGPATAATPAGAVQRLLGLISV
jgi:uncharacterized protein (TIGR00725 family)